jgi:uncharacterized protein YkwD
MSWKTGMAVLFFFALVSAIQYPRVVEFVQELSEPDTTVAVPDPVIAAPGTPTSESANSGDTTTRAVAKEDLTIHDLKLLALEFINEDRKLFGLDPVTLGTNTAAQDHAEEMVAERYLGHWWLDGRKPYMVYSEAGGTSYISENAARTGFSESEYDELCRQEKVVCEKVDPSEDIEHLQHAMVYDDAGSDWGHRDNILNPKHQKVSLGIAYSNTFLALVQHFEGGSVSAPVLPTIDGSLLRIRADINRSDINIFPTVEIYYEPETSPRTGAEIEQFTSYCVGGGFSAECGTPIARVVPPPQPGTRYLNLPDNVVVARTWVVSGGDIEIIADLGSLVSLPGHYTTAMYEDAGNGVSGDIALQLTTTKG